MPSARNPSTSSINQGKKEEGSNHLIECTGPWMCHLDKCMGTHTNSQEFLREAFPVWILCIRGAEQSESVYHGGPGANHRG